MKANISTAPAILSYCLRCAIAASTVGSSSAFCTKNVSTCIFYRQTYSKAAPEIQNKGDGK